jgi:hypothetical protein
MTTATPIYKITANSKDITDTLQRRLLELTVTDQRGMDSDSLELSVDDTDAGLVWPKRGVELQVWLGYQGEPLYSHGKYTVDELSHSGPPDKVTIRAKAPDILAGFKGSKTRSWDKTTLGAIVTQIATDNKLKPAISDKLAGTAIEHWDQTAESDLNLLTRLGKAYGAVAKPADGRLIFVEEGKSLSVSSKPITGKPITRRDIAGHTYTEAGRKEYVGVEALSYDYQKAKLTKITVSKSSTSVTDEDVYPVGKENLQRLKETKPDEATAKAAAEAEWKRLSRGKTTLELDIQYGMPGLRAETKMPVTGIRPWIDGEWVATEVTHTLSATAGLTTSVKLERPDDYAANEDATA